MSKKQINDNFGFYCILTNPLRGYDYVTNVCVGLSVPFVQLRMKDTKQINVLRVAEKLRTITEKTDTLLIINDDPLVALDCAADGVHLGQDDMAIEQARILLGPDIIIGLSTHNDQQTEDACKKNPDYIGIGPVYATPTKIIADPAIGLDGMKEMLKKATLPSVCIGGISFERLPDVLKAGAKNVCMVRPVCEAENPAKILKQLLSVLKRNREQAIP